MSTIFYSLSGEGHGHATRARTLVEALRDDYRIVLYAPDQAYAFLTGVYDGAEVEVRYLPGIPHRYKADHSFDAPRTALTALRFFTDLPTLLRRLQREIERDGPSLVITDFEPALPRAAQRCGVPFVSLTHQHVLLVSDFGALPRRLRRYTSIMAMIVGAYYRGQAETLVSSFYFPPLKPAWRAARQVGVLLRPEILRAAPEDGDQVVAYLRRRVSPNVLDALAACGCAVRVYGLGTHPSRGPLTFFDIDPYRFVEDLARCRALICTAGNQLVGEALFLEKPVLAMPEPGSHEQTVNAHFLEQSGAGLSVEMPRLAPADVRAFLDCRAVFRSHIDRECLCGNAATEAAIRRRLPQRRGLARPTFEEATMLAGA